MVDVDGGPVVANPPVAEYAKKVSDTIAYLERRTGLKPIIYTGAYFWDGYVQLSNVSGIALRTAHPAADPDAGGRAPGSLPPIVSENQPAERLRLLLRPSGLLRESASRPGPGPTG